jgi:MoxR-like ATPase
MAPSVLEHRILLRPEFEIEGYTCAEVIDRILKEVAIPR